MIAYLDARSVVSIVFRQMWKFLLVFIPITLIGVIYILGATRLYQSDAKLIVKFGQDARPEVTRETNLSAEEKRGLVQSNVNILINRDLARALIQEITIEKAFPKIAKLKETDEEKMEAATKTFEKRLIVTTESDAGIIKVGLLNTDAQISQIMLKSLIALFLEQQSEIFGNPQLDVLREQAETTRLKLDKANKELNDFKTLNGIASIDEELTLLLQQRADFAGYMSRRAVQTQGVPSEPVSISESDYENEDIINQIEPIELEENIVTDETITYDVLPAQISKAGDTSRLPVVEDKQKKLDELKSKRAELLTIYKPTSKVIKNIDRNIGVEEEALQNAVEALNAQIVDLDKQIEQKQQFRVRYDELSRQVALMNEASDAAQARLQAAEVNNDLNQRKITRISIIEEPSLPLKPSKPNKLVILVLTLLVATAFGFALALGTELLDSTFSRPEELAQYMSAAVLASFSDWTKIVSRTLKPLPQSHEWKGRVQTAIKDKKIPDIFDVIKSDKTGLDDVDVLGLYQSIESKMPLSSGKVLNFTSCYSGEGTTTIALALARFAGTSLGKNVLFIGHDNYAINGMALKNLSPCSLMDVAQGRMTIKDCLVNITGETQKIAYTYLCTGDRYDTILSNIDKLDVLLNELKKNFDLIVIPTPANITNPAGMSVAKVSDGVVIVVAAEQTRAPVVRQVVKNIEVKGGNILGLVLNKSIHYIPNFVYKYL